MCLPKLVLHTLLDIFPFSKYKREIIMVFHADWSSHILSQIKIKCSLKACGKSASPGNWNQIRAMLEHAATFYMYLIPESGISGIKIQGLKSFRVMIIRQINYNQFTETAFTYYKGFQKTDNKMPELLLLYELTIYHRSTNNNSYRFHIHE